MAKLQNIWNSDTSPALSPMGPDITSTSAITSPPATIAATSTIPDVGITGHCGETTDILPPSLHVYDKLEKLLSKSKAL